MSFQDLRLFCCVASTKRKGRSQHFARKTSCQARKACPCVVILEKLIKVAGGLSRCCVACIFVSIQAESFCFPQSKSGLNIQIQILQSSTAQPDFATTNATPTPDDIEIIKAKLPSRPIFPSCRLPSYFCFP